MNKFKKLLALVTAFALLTLPTLSASAAEERAVVLGGMPFGLTMYTSGVVVISVDGDDSPARDAGIRQNDVITRAGGEEITSNEQLKRIIDSSGGEDIELSLSRGESPISVTLTPKVNDRGGCTAGMWIRDSTAGLGTITYFDESTCSFGALGHGINDRDTGLLLPLSSGRIMNAEVTSVTKAQPGVAGGLNGYIGDEVIGSMTVNNAFGVFGRYENMPEGRRVTCADDSEITTGSATIFCTLDDSGIGEYTVEIERLDVNESSGRNMEIRVTDKALIDKCGGIVQGMSGSPIVQNGKLIGAVTHVLVNSPEKGYGITVSNMLDSYRRCGSYR